MSLVTPSSPGTFRRALTRVAAQIVTTQLLERGMVEADSTGRAASLAYSAFHNYSVGNQVLALWQCRARGIHPGPIATFHSWLDKGRHVRKGAKGLCQPKPYTRVETDPETGEEAVRAGVWFNYRPGWFVISQTDGDEVEAPALPDWNADRAMTALGVRRVAFRELDGNTQGYSQGKAIAINPVAANPVKTTVHELAHEILHQHDGELFLDTDQLPRTLREVEAEATALIVLEALGQPGADNARGYIQHWLGAGQTIPDTSAARIFAAADKILRAGHPAEALS